jgi:predicted PolB exonuclease-like 3'-5' exonuclease
MPTLIFDIETVPDYTLWTPPEPPPAPAPEPPATAEANGVAQPDIQPAKKSRSRKKAPATPAEDKEPFPPLYACKPVAIGYVLLDDNLAMTAGGCLGTSSYGLEERRMLTDWADLIGNTNGATLVTYNGRAFDVPVLALRAFRWGLPQHWYTKDVRYRYGEDSHVDLCDTLTEFGAVQKKGFSLDAMATVIGLPTKCEANGGKVLDMFKNGQIQQLESYCLTDAVKTAFIYMRYLLMRGRIGLADYQRAAKALLDTCVAANMHGVAFGCDPKRLLLQD